MHQILNFADSLFSQIPTPILKRISKISIVLKTAFWFILNNIIIGVFLTSLVISAIGGLFYYFTHLNSFTGYIFLVIIGIIILVIILSYAMALYARKIVYPPKMNTNIINKRLRTLEFRKQSTILNLGSNSPSGYFSHPPDEEIRKKLLQIKASHTKGGIILTGVNGVGKTRLALQTAKEIFPDYTLVIWPNVIISDEDLNIFAEERIVVFLDDLTSLAATDEKARILFTYVQRLRSNAPEAVLIITCPSISEATVQRRFRSFLYNLRENPIQINPINLNSQEGKDFIKFVYKQKQRDPYLTIEPELFDGKPGSVFSSLEEHADQLRHNTPLSALNVLKTLLLLHRAHIPPTLSRVQSIATTLFALTPGNWKKAIDHLKREYWIMPMTKNNQIRVPNITYLTRCLPEVGYGEEEQSLDLGRMIAAIDITDAESLFALSNALYECHQYQDGLEALRLITTNVSQQDKLWADAQQLTGLIYSEIAGVGNIKAQEASIKAYKSALSAYKFESDPVEWAITQNNLGNILQQREQEDHEVNLEEAISAYQESLRLFTPDQFPLEFAETKTHIGDSYEQLASYRQENKRDAFYQALTSYEEALQIYTIENYSNEFAEIQMKIGNIYQFGLQQGSIHAISAYDQALHYSSEDLKEQKARILVNLAGAYTDRHKEGDIDRAIECGYKALQYLESQRHDIQWARAQNILGNAFLLRNSHEGNDIGEAIHYYELALTVFEENSDYWAVTQNNLGLAYKKQYLQSSDEGVHYLDIAEDYFNNAIDNYQNENDLFLLVKSLSNRASLHLLWAKIGKQQGDYAMCREKCAIAIRGLRTALSLINAEDFPYHYKLIKSQLEGTERQTC